MTSVSEDFVILFLPCTVPALGTFSVNYPVSLELDLCELFKALVEVGFLHNGFISVSVSSLLFQFWATKVRLSFEVYWTK